MEEFNFLKSIKQYKKTYAELARCPKHLFDQPALAWISSGKLKYNISIDSEDYTMHNNNNLSYFFANNNVKITFLEKPKNIVPTFILKWCNISDVINSIKIMPSIVNIGLNEQSLCSLFIEISGQDLSVINLYNDTNVPQDIIFEIEKKQAMKILQENLDAEIAVSQLPWLHEIRERLHTELIKIDAIISKLESNYIEGDEFIVNDDINATKEINAIEEINE